jgi:hypothetical protein
MYGNDAISRAREWLQTSDAPYNNNNNDALLSQIWVIAKATVRLATLGRLVRWVDFAALFFRHVCGLSSSATISFPQSAVLDTVSTSSRATVPVSGRRSIQYVPASAAAARAGFWLFPKGWVSKVLICRFAYARVVGGSQIGAESGRASRCKQQGGWVGGTLSFCMGSSVGQ